jgi:signal recognition particle subunit SRP19
MQKKDKIVLWPLYFDSTKRRVEGRKVAKGGAISSPKLVEVVKALEELGFRYDVVSGASHPKFPWLESGMLIVSKVGSKTEMIRKVARQLLLVRKGR